MSNRLAVVKAISKHGVPHIVEAFQESTDRTGGHGIWLDLQEIKDIVKAASIDGVAGIGKAEWQAILEIEKYDRIGPKARTYFDDLKKRWQTAATPAGGFAVSLTHAAKFKDKLLSDDPGWKRFKGECAAGVQYVFHKARRPLGVTTSWKQGVRVKGNNVRPGTAIAAFRNGKYSQDHAAIFIRETSTGLEVWDQFNNPRKPWGKRILRFMNNNDRSNNGNLFFVITK